jgi:hypothetical protein
LLARAAAESRHDQCHLPLPRHTQQLLKTQERRRIETGHVCEIELGLMERSELDKAIAAWQEWGNQPDAFWARSWCEAVGWKQ